MWKKNQPESRPAPTQRVAPPPKPMARGPAATATIGPSISIKGDLTGEEDLVIEGEIQGEIKFANHSVTVGNKGRVKADVYGKSICIEGQVFGNLWGQDEVVIRQTGKVEGNLTSPRVTLEDGSSFRGAIDMQSPQARAAQNKPPKPEAAKAAQGQKAPGAASDRRGTTPSRGGSGTTVQAKRS